MKKFGLIGAPGYIAPRHMQAIKVTGNELVAALDPNDSVGIIDSYFPNADFFTEFERFDRHVDLLKRRDEKIDYMSICSPNYLHDAHIRFALRSNINAICEKPLVLNPRNMDGLLELEQETGRKVNTILQLRLHPAIKALKTQVSESRKKKVDVDLTYITSRGHWYQVSWKGDKNRSGGIATNIGVHFFDMLNFIFGDLQESILHYSSATAESGYLEYEHARVRWFLSIDAKHLPDDIKAKDQRTYRSVKVGEQEVEFSDGFTDLHTMSYQKILEGNGFNIEDSRVAIDTVSKIRNTKPLGKKGDYHPFVDRLSEL